MGHSRSIRRDLSPMVANNISSPTARESSIKLFYAKAASLGRSIRTFDIKGAYLKSNMDTEMYMLLPKQRATDPLQWVKLLKSIYGLRQAGKLWFENIRAVLLENKFKQCLQDECIFSLFDADTNTDIDVVLFVDDFLTSSENDHSSNQLLNILRGKYGEVSETTPSETHLGIKWETLPTGDIKISQPG